MTQGTLTESITRSLAYMLRHQPEEFDLEVDEQGWADLDEVTEALTERLGETIENEDVAEAIGAGDRQRYEIDGDRVRALYGHSFSIDPGEASEPPELLYVGVGSRDAERAEERGLRSGRRAFLHLALEFEEAQEMGRRVAPEYAVVTVRAGEAWEDGVQFYDRVSLFLAEGVPTDFLEVSEIFTDGIRRERRGGRSRGGRGDRPERSNRVRGRRRREEHDDERPEREDEAPRRESRREEPRREEPRREEPRREEPPAPAAASEPSGGFGLGILSAEPAPEPQPAPEPAPEPVPEPVPEPEPAPEPEPTAEPESSEPDNSGFGAGLL